MRKFFEIGQKRPKAILLCPGPVLLSKTVQRAVRTTNVGHREVEFSNILTESTAMLKPIVGIDNDHEIAFITGSGTAANETVLSGFGTLGPLLVISNGEFGERLYDVAKLHNGEVKHLQLAWQQKIDLAVVAKTLQAKQYYMVAIVHHETSTGMLNPINQIAKLAHQYGAFVFVDAISSIGAEDIQIAKWDIDIMVGTSGKALSAMPGAGILIVRSSLVDKLKEPSGASHYLDLYKHFYYMRNHIQTPNTPAVHVFVSLHASLKEITKFGIQNFQAIIRQRATYTQNAITRMGLDYATYEGNNSSVITCVTLPSYLSFDYLSQRLKEKGIIIYNGKGVLKDKIFQIGHIGALRKQDTPYSLRQLDKILRKASLVNLTTPLMPDQPVEAINAIT